MKINIEKIKTQIRSNIREIIIILLTLILIISLIVLFVSKLKFKKELKEKEQIILNLEISNLNNIDYQKTKKEYEKVNTDTNRIIPIDKRKELFSKYFR